MNKKFVSALAELRNAPLDAENPHFKSRYTRLGTLIDHAKGVLAKHGLAIVQDVTGDGESVFVTTIVVGDEGEVARFGPLAIRPERPGPQAVGSAITYARRYALAAALGIAADEDDDANTAEARPGRQAREAAPAAASAPAPHARLASKRQVAYLFAKAREAGLYDEVREWLRERGEPDESGHVAITVPLFEGALAFLQARVEEIERSAQASDDTGVDDYVFE